MNVDQYLNDLKVEYEKTVATDHLRESGWTNLRRKMFEKKIFRFGFIFILVFATLLGTYNMVSAAMPNNVLYKAKIATENALERTTGDNQIAIDHRAEEIVKLSEEIENSSSNLDQVVAEYTKSVNDAKTKVPAHGKKYELFRRKLEIQHKKFDEIAEKNPKVAERIKNARDASEHDR